MVPLKFRDTTRIFADKTCVALDEELTGDADSGKFARAVTYLRDDTDRAYRFYPRWPDTAGRNVEIGKLFKKGEPQTHHNQWPDLPRR